MTQQLLITRINQLPEEFQKEVLLFTEFLISKAKKGAKTNNKKSRGGYGSHKGDYIMSDDFDEPLEDFKEYM